jgi:hypothetical protein
MQPKYSWYNHGIKKINQAITSAPLTRSCPLLLTETFVAVALFTLVGLLVAESKVEFHECHQRTKKQGELACRRTSSLFHGTRDTSHAREQVSANLAQSVNRVVESRGNSLANITKSTVTFIKNHRFYITNAISELTNRVTQFLACRRTISLEHGLREINHVADQTRANTLYQRLGYTRGDILAQTNHR